MLIDNANQHRLLSSSIGSDGINFRTAMVKLLGNFRSERIFMGGNDRELICCFRGFQQEIAYECGDEAIENAQCHGFIIDTAFGIHKNRGNGNDGI